MTSSPEMLSGAGSLDQPRSPALNELHGNPDLGKLRRDILAAQLQYWVKDAVRSLIPEVSIESTSSSAPNQQLAATDAPFVQQKSAEAIPSELLAQAGALDESQRAFTAYALWEKEYSTANDSSPLALAA